MTPTPKQWHRIILTILVLAALIGWGALAAKAADRYTLGSDWIIIEDHGNAAALVTYHNSADRGSWSRAARLTAPNGVEVDSILTTRGGSEAESLTLTPVDPSLVAVQPQSDVPDGETVYVLIVRPAF